MLYPFYIETAPLMKESIPPKISKIILEVGHPFVLFLT